MDSESIVRGHEGERNNCFSKIQLVDIKMTQRKFESEAKLQEQVTKKGQNGKIPVLCRRLAHHARSA